MSLKLHTHPRLVVIGDPVAYSLSPLIHNTALTLNKIAMSYEALRVSSSELKSFAAKCRDGQFAGANVTIPHKEAIIEFLDDLSPVASALRAVNTIRIEEGESPRLIGDNTDVFGFSRPLLECGHELRGADCLVWGSGGAARAIVYAMFNTFSAGMISVVSRNREKTERLIADLRLNSHQIQIIDWSNTEDVAAAEYSARLLVNATPLGMASAPDMMPCSDPKIFHDRQIVYDIVYKPLMTRLMREAQKRGAVVIGGLDMLIGQASQSFRQWTGTEMPEAEVREALKSHFDAVTRDADPIEADRPQSDR